MAIPAGEFHSSYNFRPSLCQSDDPGRPGPLPTTESWRHSGDVPILLKLPQGVVQQESRHVERRKEAHRRDRRHARTSHLRPISISGGICMTNSDSDLSAPSPPGICGHMQTYLVRLFFPHSFAIVCVVRGFSGNLACSQSLVSPMCASQTCLALVSQTAARFLF